jgi:hypothetical protein
MDGEDQLVDITLLTLSYDERLILAEVDFDESAESAMGTDTGGDMRPGP